MANMDAGMNCYCHFCGNPMRFHISRAGEAVNCFNCGMETVLFIPGLEAPYSEEQYPLAMKEFRWSNSDLGIRHLEGIVENKSARRLDWVRIEFILYNRPNCPVGTTSDCWTDLPPGENWKFRAPVSQADAQHASEPLLSCEYGRVMRPRAVASNGASMPQKSL